MSDNDFFKQQEAKRIGELMFLFKDTYGLTEESMKQALIEVLNTEEYKTSYANMVKEATKYADDKYWAIHGKS